MLSLWIVLQCVRCLFIYGIYSCYYYYFFARVTCAWKPRSSLGTDLLCGALLQPGHRPKCSAFLASHSVSVARNRALKRSAMQCHSDRMTRGLAGTLITWTPPHAAFLPKSRIALLFSCAPVHRLREVWNIFSSSLCAPLSRASCGAAFGFVPPLCPRRCRGDLREVAPYSPRNWVTLYPFADMMKTRSRLLP